MAASTLFRLRSCWPSFRASIGSSKRVRASASGIPRRYAVPEVAAGNTHVYAQYTIRAPDRDRLAGQLKLEGIPTAVYYPKCLHEQPVFAHLGCRFGDFPESERASREVISLPMHPFLSEAEQERVISALISLGTEKY